MAHPYAKIHVAAKQLGLNEDAQRDVYERVTGERSLRAMNGPQLAAVNTEMVRLGFKPARAKGNKLSGTCPKLAEACHRLFDNMVNFRGYNRIPGNDRAMLQVDPDDEYGNDGSSLFGDPDDSASPETVANPAPTHGGFFGVHLGGDE